MQEQKIKIKDLASDCNLSTKEIIAVLNEVGIPGKTTQNTIFAEEAEKVKAKILANQASHTEVVRKEVQPGVVLRRKVSEHKPEAELEKTQAKPETKPETKPEAKSVAKADSKTVAKSEVKAELKAEAKSEKTKSTTEKAKNEKSEAPSGKAKIIEAKKTDSINPENNTESPTSHSDSTNQKNLADKSASPNNDSPQELSQEKTAQDLAKKTAEHSKAKKAKEKAPEINAKIIRPVDNTPKAVAPVSAPELKAEPEIKPEIKPETQPEAKPELKTEIKTETQSAVVKTDKANSQAPVEKVKESEFKTKAKPDASARPDGSSTASILPTIKSEHKTESRRPQDQNTNSQVRVISRPDPNKANIISTPSANTQNQDRPRYDNRPQGDRPQGDRPYRPQGDRPQGDRPYRPQGDRPQGDRPQGDRPYRPQGDRPQGDRPQGDRPYRPQGDRPQGDRPQGDRPYRPQGDRPQGQRPFTPRPDGNTNRPFIDKDRDKDAMPQTRGARPKQGVKPNTPNTPFAATFPSTEESRKKRNKNQNKRGPDYTQPASSKFGSFDDDGMPRMRSRSRKAKAKIIPQSTQPMKAAKRKIRIEEAIRVSDMAHQMGLKASEIIKILFNLGVMATINSALDIDTATLVAAEFEYEVEKFGFSEQEALTNAAEADHPEQLRPRPPVVTIMGHVDHGKTSLLDAIRKTHVASGEAGGITQHIGAYHVSTKRGDIVFLDTPGHEAFTAMRARGAQVTDIVILVVAADDGVMEQTREAINHSKAAGVPIIVAVNKMDKEGADPDRVLRELSELGLQAESWGGDTVVSYVSAKARQGLDELLELVALQAELMELKSNPDKNAKGHIVEAKLDKGRGPVATVLIQEGTLNQGDAFVCGVFSGRVRALFNDQGRKVKSAGPSMPVEVQGFEGVPEAGEEFVALNDEKTARRIADARATKQRERELARESKVTLETFLSRKASDVEAQVLNLVLKADVQGSLEAITESLLKLSTEKVRINIIHGGAGSISESDILLASASEAIIIGFNIRPTAKIKEVAEQENVEIRFYDIIYKLSEEIKSAMAGMLAPIKKEVYLGQAEVRQPFTLPKIGTIAGSIVTDGKILRNAGARLLRDSVVIYTGKIVSLKHIKDDKKEVLKGNECGIGLENYNDIKIGDIIEAYETVEEAATL